MAKKQKTYQANVNDKRYIGRKIMDYFGTDSVKSDEAFNKIIDFVGEKPSMKTIAVYGIFNTLCTALNNPDSMPEYIETRAMEILTHEKMIDAVVPVCFGALSDSGKRRIAESGLYCCQKRIYVLLWRGLEPPRP